MITARFLNASNTRVEVDWGNDQKTVMTWPILSPDFLRKLEGVTPAAYDPEAPHPDDNPPAEA